MCDMAARNGRGGHTPLNPNYQPPPSLSAEQAAAVKQILGSRDFITLFRGGAGTGKSFALNEVERGLVAAKHPVVVLAPQRQQVQDLQTDGLPAETLARFLEKKQLPRDAVVIVDEADQERLVKAPKSVAVARTCRTSSYALTPRTRGKAPTPQSIGHENMYQGSNPLSGNM
jgi:hypothetical protein